jgi:RNA polymerase sigma factor (sigma-70 family)
VSSPIPVDPLSFEEAVASLFRERFASLRRYLDRLTGDPDLAADLAQSAFVRLYQRGTMPDEPAAWLITVAMNAFRDTHRRGERRAALVSEYGDDVIAPAAPADAEDTVIADESRARVRRALDTLSERDRTLLLLRHEGYSYRELARIVGVSETSVGTLLLRATHAFRTTFLAHTDALDTTLD